MKKLTTRFVAVAVAGALAISGALVALASPVSTDSAVASGAEAAMKAPTPRQNFDVYVSMSLKAKSPVKKGTKVKIKGNLVSIFTTCTAGKTVTTPKGDVVTNQYGQFGWTQKIRTKTKVTAVFAGYSEGVHPDIINCGSATASKTIKVKR